MFVLKLFSKLMYFLLKYSENFNFIKKLKVSLKKSQLGQKNCNSWVSYRYRFHILIFYTLLFKEGGHWYWDVRNFHKRRSSFPLYCAQFTAQRGTFSIVARNYWWAVRHFLLLRATTQHRL